MLYILLLIVIIIILIRLFNREGFKEGVDATNTDVSGVVVSNVVANDGDDAKTQDNLPKPNNEIIFRKLDILDKRLKVIENRFEEFDNQ
jgi:hypothetical protein